MEQANLSQVKEGFYNIKNKLLNRTKIVIHGNKVLVYISFCEIILNVVMWANYLVIPFSFQM